MYSIRSLVFALLLVAPPAFGGDRSHRHHDHDVDFDFGIDLFSIEQDGPRERIRVLDLLIVSAFELDKRPNHERMEVLDVPLVSLYRTRRDHDKSTMRVLDLPLVSLFRMDQEGTDESDLRVLDLPIIGSLFRQKVDGRHRRTEVLFLISVESEQAAAGPPAAP